MPHVMLVRVILILHDLTKPGLTLASSDGRIKPGIADT